MNVRRSDDKQQRARTYKDSRGKFRVQLRHDGRHKTLAVFSSKREANAFRETPEFKLACDEALESEAPLQPRTSNRFKNPEGSTLKTLMWDYFKSSEFLDLDPTTQVERRRLGEDILLRKTKDPNLLFGDYPVGGNDPSKCFGGKHIRALMADKKDEPNAANHRRKLLSVLFNWAIDNRLHDISANPVTTVRKRELNEDAGHNPWTDDDCRRFEETHSIGTMARLAYELFYCTGQRISDVVRFGPSQVKNGHLCFTQKKKRKGRKVVKLELAMPARLTEAINAVPGAWDEERDRFLVTEHGKAFASEKAFGNRLRKWVVQAGLGDRDISAHGLRHHMGNMLADNGATEVEIAAVLGVSLRTTSIYVKRPAQRRNASAALAKLPGMQAPALDQPGAFGGDQSGPANTNVRHSAPKNLSHSVDFIRVLAVPAGLEPATFAFEARCSIR